jgi:glucosylceramidase
MTFKRNFILIIIALTSCFASCKKTTSNPDPTPTPTPNPTTNEVDFWLTKGDQSVKFEKQNTVLGFTSPVNIYPNIDIDLQQTYQSIDGFGYTLTGGSAQVINQLNATKKQELLQDLFSTNGIAVNYLRISIGASDMNAAPFTYNDLPSGQTDITLTECNSIVKRDLINKSEYKNNGYTMDCS